MTVPGPVALGPYIIRALDDECEDHWIVEHEDGRAVAINGQPLEFERRDDALRWATLNRDGQCSGS